MVLEENEECKAELDKIESKKPDYRWLLFHKAEYYSEQNKINESVGVINNLLEKNPGFATILRLSSWMENLKNNPEIKWPQK